MLRSRWGVHKIREDGDLHHCIDAAVVAATSPALTQRLTEYHKRRETLIKTPGGYADPATGELLEQTQDFRIPEPWPRFRQELEARLSPDPQQQLDRLKLPTYETDEIIRPAFASRMPNHKVTGAAHAETVRSSKAGEGMTVSKVPLDRLSVKGGRIVSGNAEYYNPASDMLLYNALLAQLQRFGGDGAKAFAQPFYKPKHDGTPGPRVEKVKMVEKSTLSLPVNHGVAANGNMVRIDVFHVEDDSYYFVPIYVADTKKKQLPAKAVCAHKPYAQWKDMDDRDFLFSLYAGDLVRIEGKRPIKLTLAKGGTGEKFIARKDSMYYYQGANIANGQIHISTHDRRYEQPGLGFKTLQSVEKYQVDILGNYYPVKSPEKRMPFRKEK